MPFVLHKEGRAGLKNNSLYRNADGQLCVWNIEDNAYAHMQTIKTSWESWRVRPANSNDYVPLNARMLNGKKSYKVMDEGAKQVAKKITSVGCLVDVFEDFEKRKFAIATKSNGEDEFITEISSALGASTPVDWSVRLRELLPLIVDICCKYRGYKAEKVEERRELVAGDLDMPRPQSA